MVFNRLEQAVNIRAVYATLQLLTDQRLDPLRSDSRFGKLLATMLLG
jgi:hypothetical protein